MRSTSPSRFEMFRSNTLLASGGLAGSSSDWPAGLRPKTIPSSCSHFSIPGLVSTQAKACSNGFGPNPKVCSVSLSQKRRLLHAVSYGPYHLHQLGPKFQRGLLIRSLQFRPIEVGFCRREVGWSQFRKWVNFAFTVINLCEVFETLRIDICEKFACVSEVRGHISSFRLFCRSSVLQLETTKRIVLTQNRCDGSPA